MMNNLMQMLTQIKSNPAAMLSQYGIPQDIVNNPQAVVQHLMNTGRVSQAQYDRAVSMAQSMGMGKK
jgi:hypothetical protein